MAIVRMSADEAQREGRANHKKLRATSEADIRQHEIEDGFNPDEELTGAVKIVSPAIVRKKLGMTQAVFARELQIPLATIRNWEQQRTVPDPAARTLFSILYQRPSAISALKKKPSARATATSQRSVRKSP